MVAQARAELADAREGNRSLPGHIGAHARAEQDGVAKPSRKSAKRAAQRGRKKAAAAAAAAAVEAHTAWR